MGGAASKRCSAGAGEAFCVVVGCGLAILTSSANAAHMTAGSRTGGSRTGSSSVRGINGECASSMSLSDLALSNASKESSVNIDDCSHDESLS